MKKAKKAWVPGKGRKIPKKEEDVSIVASAIGKAAIWKKQNINSIKSEV